MLKKGIFTGQRKNCTNKFWIKNLKHYISTPNFLVNSIQESPPFPFSLMLQKHIFTDILDTNFILFKRYVTLSDHEGRSLS